MANARHLQGTLLTRVTGLLQTGVLKTPPVWLDIVERFLPDNPAANEQVPRERPAKLVYPHDDVRREARAKTEGFNKEALNLFDSQPDDAQPFSSSLVERYIRKYEDLLESGMDKEECHLKCSQFFETELRHKRERQKNLRKGILFDKTIEKVETSEEQLESSHTQNILSLLDKPTERRPNTPNIEDGQ